MPITKRIVTALATVLLLAVSVGSASARSLSVSNQNFRAIWTSLEGVEARCRVTLEGSFHTRTIAKVTGSLIGAITRAMSDQANCTNGTIIMFNGVERFFGATTINTLPWHTTFGSFSGTLPNISSTRVALSRLRFGIRDSFGACTGQYGNETDAVSLSAAREAGGGITSLTPVEGSNNVTLIRRDAGIFCPNPGRLRNPSGPLTLLGTNTRITVTLI